MIRALPVCLLGFLTACFALPTEAAFSLVFYLAVIPPVLGQRPHLPPWPAPALIVWSGLTLLWGGGDRHRNTAFALGAVCTFLFVLALQKTLCEPALRRRLGMLLIWAGTLNALWSIARGVALHTIAPQLLGWGVTHHPILGASVMAGAMLTALVRALTERPYRAAYLVACAVMAVFILLTESRGPLLAVCIALLTIGLTRRWRVRAALLAAAGGLLWLLQPTAWRQHQLGILLDRGTHHRLEVWQRTLELVRQKPLFGHGLAANLDLPGLTFPHDLFLGVLFYSGLVGAVLFLALTYQVTRRLIGMADTPDRLWLSALWVNALASGLTDLGQVTKGPGPLWIIFWLPVGLVLAYPTRINPPPSSDSQATAAARCGESASVSAQKSGP